MKSGEKVGDEEGQSSKLMGTVRCSMLLWSNVSVATRPVMSTLIDREYSAIYSLLQIRDNTQTAPSPESIRWYEERENQSPHRHSTGVHNSQQRVTTHVQWRASFPRHHTINVSILDHSTVSIKYQSRSPLSFTIIDLAQRSSPIGSLVHVPDETIITTPPLFLNDVLIIYSFCSSGWSSLINCWRSRGCTNCSGKIQLASSIGNPFQRTRYSLIFCFSF